MRKLLVALLPLILLVAACKKEKSLEENTGNPTNPGGGGNTAGYYLRAKIDGVDKTFNTNLFAIKQDTLGFTQYAVLGNVANDPNNLESLAVTISSTLPVTSGSNYTVEDTTFAYILVAIYNPNSQTLIFGSGNGDQSNNPLKLTITAISATEIAGTFSGTIFQSDSNNPNDPNPPTKTITNGEFKAKFL